MNEGHFTLIIAMSSYVISKQVSKGCATCLMLEVLPFGNQFYKRALGVGGLYIGKLCAYMGILRVCVMLARCICWV